ncbi:glucose/galactose MFS transporter, partial [Methylobacterium radiotolerans]
IAEIGVSNLFINFVSQPEIGALTHAQASRYLFLLWGGIAEIGVSNLFINFVSQPEIGALTHAQASRYLFL